MLSHGQVYLYRSLMTDVMFDPQKLELNLVPQFLVCYTRYEVC